MEEASVVIKDRVVKSTVENLEIPDVGFDTFIRRICGRYNKNIALVAGDTTCSFTQLEEESCTVATGLRSTFGFGPGHVAAFLADNSIDLVFALFGAVFAGGALTFLKTSLTEGEVFELLELSRPGIVFCDINNAEKARAASSKLTCVKALVSFGEFQGMVDFSNLKRIAHSSPRREAAVSITSPESLLATFYTSGSTGTPKGAQLSHKSFISALVCFQHGNHAVTESQTYLAYTPLMHMGGFFTFCLMLSVGAKAVILGVFDLDVALTAATAHKDIICIIYPTYIAPLLDNSLLKEIDLQKFRAIITGGSTAPGRLLQRLADRFRHTSILHVYGLTETSGLITFSRKSTKDVSSAGSPVAMTEIKVVDLDTREKLGPGECGEICIRGPTCIMGYQGASGATGCAYDDSGFLQTGDTGCYTESGEIYVLGRIKDQFKCHDQQVAPSVLEDFLLMHPHVRDVVVAGVPHASLGEAARAFIVLQRGVPADNATAQTLQDFVKGSLPFHKQLHGGVQFLEHLPTTETGKNLRRTLKDKYLSMSK